MSFRLASVTGRATLVANGGFYDLERASGGAFSADLMSAIARFAELHDVAAGLAVKPDQPYDQESLGICVPRPQKIFGIGLNYRAHAKESGLEAPPKPLVFAKFPNCLNGPLGDITLYGETTDWEAELVVVMGTSARDIAAEDAWQHIAGFTCGQDVSERRTQFASKPPHFDLGKSYDTHGPIGPEIVSIDSFEDPGSLALSCDVNGERKQESRTDDMIFDIPALIAYISSVCTFEPGDLIFTGTPSGVGSATRTYLKAGDVVTTGIEGIGRMVNRCVAT